MALRGKGNRSENKYHLSETIENVLSVDKAKLSLTKCQEYLHIGKRLLMHDFPMPEALPKLSDAENCALRHQNRNTAETIGMYLTNLAAKLTKEEFRLALREDYQVTELSLSDPDVQHKHTKKTYTMTQMAAGGFT